MSEREIVEPEEENETVTRLSDAYRQFVQPEVDRKNKDMADSSMTWPGGY